MVAITVACATCGEVGGRTSETVDIAIQNVGAAVAHSFTLVPVKTCITVCVRIFFARQIGCETPTVNAFLAFSRRWLATTVICRRLASLNASFSNATTANLAIIKIFEASFTLIA